MIYPNSPRLREYLEHCPSSLRRQRSFQLDEGDFVEHLAEIQLQHQGMSAEQASDRAAYRCITNKSKPHHVHHAHRYTLRVVILAILLIFAILFAVSYGYSQTVSPNVNPAIVVAACNGATLTAGNRAQLQVGPDGALCISGMFSATVDTTGLATDTIQTNGSQKSQLVDAGGEAATVTSGKLDVNAAIDTTGLATSTKQDTGNTSLTSIDTKLTGPISVTGALTIPNPTTVAGTVTVTDGAGALNVIVDSGAIASTCALCAIESGGNLATIAGKDFATAANQTSGNSSLTTIAAKDFATEATQALQATAANQTTGNSSLSTITTNTNLPPTVTVTSVVVDYAASTLLASNASRKSAVIVNNSPSPLIVKFGAVPTYSDFTLQIPPFQSQALPVPTYTGIVYGRWLPPINPQYLNQAQITEIQ